MKRVIKAFEKFPEAVQEEIYALFQAGELNKATFPFSGSIAEGVIFVNEEEETTYLIPVSTIKASKMSSASDDEEEDDTRDDDGQDDLDIGDDMEEVDDEE